jgi:multidrug/hemolysin transport system permease protein
MPIANFGEGLQKVVSFLPGTYGTSLVRNHAMRGAFQQMVEEGVPQEVVDSIKASLDLYPKLLDKTVEIPQMYLILGGSVVVLMAIYLILNMCKKKA